MWSKFPIDDENDTADQTGVERKISLGGQPLKQAGGNLSSLTIGLIDFYRLNQECLTKALGDHRSVDRSMTIPAQPDTAELCHMVVT